MEIADIKGKDIAYLAVRSCSLAGALCILGLQLLSNPLDLSTLAAIGTLALAFVQPSIAITLMLVLLPLGGNRPSSPHALYTLLISCGLYLGIECRTFLRGKESQKTVHVNSILFCMLAYTLASVLSLVALPWPATLESLPALSFDQLLTVTEHSPVYPLLSVFNTLLACALGLCVFRICSVNRLARAAFPCAIFAGLLASIFFGLLDYYEIISLASFRELDPIVNPDNVQFRLQSFFAHSGWYAEFITLTIPFALVILTWQLPFWLRTLVILVSILAGEFALILAYQRGGWLSYPLTLIAIWVAIYVTHRLEKGSTDFFLAFKKSLFRVVISLPLTIVVSLALVTVLKKDYTNDQVISGYLDRLKTITHTSDRSNFFFAGALIGLKHPILGAGSESFALEFEREFEDPSSENFQRFDLPLHGSAHNVYAQTFAGKGTLGLLTLLACCFFLVFGLRHLRDSPDLEFKDQTILLMGACFAVAFLIYGNVQEIFYIQSLQLLFFATLGLTASVIPVETTKNYRKFLWIFPIALLLHLGWEFVYPGNSIARWTKPIVKKCYPVEPHPEFKKFRWCGPDSYVQWDKAMPSIEGARVEILLQTSQAVGHSSIPVSILVDNTVARTVTVKTTPTAVTIPVSELESNSIIQFGTPAYFVPARQFPASADQRKLSLQVLSICVYTDFAHERLDGPCLF